MIKSTEWHVYQSLGEDEELFLSSHPSRDEAETVAGDLAAEYDGDHFMVYGNNAASPCWMSW